MKRNKNSASPQISINDLYLSVGDKLYKGNELYASVSAVTDNLYMLSKTTDGEEISIPYRKEILIDQILSGKYTVEVVRF